ncbi:hypothetical protein Tco_0146431 [Tanacetum coccineum]
MKIGNGERAYAVYDNWCRVAIIQNLLTHRDIYNARVKVNIVVKDIVTNGICKWPSQWIDKCLTLSQYQNISLDDSKNDELVWRNKKGKDDEDVLISNVVVGIIAFIRRKFHALISSLILLV